MKRLFNTHKSINEIHHVNKLKDKNHMTISIDAEKAFQKLRYPFMFNNKPTANIILSGEKLKISKIRNKTKMLTFSTLFQHSTGVLAIPISQEKENKSKLERKK